MCTIERWIGSCDCCTDCDAAEECQRKGRLLHRAHAHVKDKLDLMVTESRGWGPEAFAGDLNFLQQAQGVVAAVAGRALQKVFSLNHLPYTLA